MKRTGLRFDVEDREYFDRLMEYIRLNHNKHFMFCKEGEEDFLISDYINKRNRKNAIIIKDGGGDIEKYQKASSVCSELFEICEVGGREALPSANGYCRTICVTSAGGGEGKSTVAKALSCRIAQKGGSILYLDINPFPGDEPPFLTEGSNPVTRVYGLVYERDQSLVFKLKALAKRDVSRRIDYITNSKPSADGFFNSDDADFFMDQICKKEVYDVIVLDVPCFPTEGYSAIMSRCDASIMVNGSKNRFRESKLVEYLENKGAGPILKVTNFGGEGEISLPRCENVFKGVPDGYWRGIDSILEGIGF